MILAISRPISGVVEGLDDEDDNASCASCTATVPLGTRHRANPAMLPLGAIVLLLLPDDIPGSTVYAVAR